MQVSFICYKEKIQTNYEIALTQFPLKYMKCIANKIPHKYDSFCC